MNNVLVFGKNGAHHQLFADLFKTEEIQHKHTFDTKYYTSDVYFHLYSLHDPPPKDLLSKSQSYIFVIDTYDSFKALQAHEKELSHYSIETKLCVSFDEITNHQLLSNWCIDNGYELINIKEQNINRIFEAIECTMWSDMKMKNKETRTIIMEDVKEEVSEKDDSVEKEKAILENYFKDMKNGSDFEENVGAKEELEFDSLLRDMMALKYNTGNLDSEQRKEKAAQLALKLFSTMGGEESE